MLSGLPNWNTLQIRTELFLECWPAGLQAAQWSWGWKCEDVLPHLQARPSLILGFIKCKNTCATSCIFLLPANHQTSVFLTTTTKCCLQECSQISLKFIHPPLIKDQSQQEAQTLLCTLLPAHWFGVQVCCTLHKVCVGLLLLCSCCHSMSFTVTSLCAASGQAKCHSPRIPITLCGRAVSLHQGKGHQPKQQ